MLGGTATVESAPGEGTALAVSLPVVAPAANGAPAQADTDGSGRHAAPAQAHADGGGGGRHAAPASDAGEDVIRPATVAGGGQ